MCNGILSTNPALIRVNECRSIVSCFALRGFLLLSHCSSDSTVAVPSVGCDEAFSCGQPTPCRCARLNQESNQSSTMQFTVNTQHTQDRVQVCLDKTKVFLFLLFRGGFSQADPLNLVTATVGRSRLKQNFSAVSFKTLTSQFSPCKVSDESSQ